MYLVDALSLHEAKSILLLEISSAADAVDSSKTLLTLLGITLCCLLVMTLILNLTEGLTTLVLKNREFAPYPTNQVILNANNVQAFNFGNLEGSNICAGMAHSPITGGPATIWKGETSDLTLYRELESGYELHPDIVREIDKFHGTLL